MRTQGSFIAQPVMAKVTSKADKKSRKGHQEKENFCEREMTQLTPKSYKRSPEPLLFNTYKVR